MESDGGDEMGTKIIGLKDVKEELKQAFLEASGRKKLHPIEERFIEFIAPIYFAKMCYETLGCSCKRVYLSESSYAKVKVFEGFGILKGDGTICHMPYELREDLKDEPGFEIEYVEG